MMVKYNAVGLGVLAAIALLGVACGYCLKGWVKAGQKCYKIFPLNNPEKTIDELENEHCRKNGGLLMNVKTQELNNLAHDLMQSVSQKRPAIMGLNDRQTEGKYKWSDGTNLEKSWINWSKRQPDNGVKLLREEDCTRMYNSGEWDDFPCQEPILRHGTLCEKPTEDACKWQACPKTSESSECISMQALSRIKRDDVSLAAGRGYTGLYELRTGMFEIDSTVEMPSLMRCAVLCSRHDNCRGIHFRANVTSECVLLKESTENDVFNCELVACYIKTL